MNMMMIRIATTGDFEQIWHFFKPIAEAGETYAFDREVTKDKAFDICMTLPNRTYVYEKDGEILGSYYLKTNQSGGGSHVCNCEYMVSESTRAHGVAAKMCDHSQQVARELGYLAMQFNFVVKTNDGAIRLQQKLGFDIVGRLPKAFNHLKQGLVDALVMYKWLN